MAKLNNAIFIKKIKWLSFLCMRNYHDSVMSQTVMLDSLAYQLLTLLTPTNLQTQIYE